MLNLPAQSDEDRKRVIGLHGEMLLAMELHLHGWQVYRAYIDEQVDFIIARYYCSKCKCFSELEKRQKQTKKKKKTAKKKTTGGRFPTDRCAKCKTQSLRFVFRLIQAKTSEGVPSKTPGGTRKFSFHAKLRSNVDDRAFYAWIAILTGADNKPEPHFFIFHHKEIGVFDNLNLDSYQKTDNQKTTLRIAPDGTVKNRSKKYDFSGFNGKYRDGFDQLENILPIDEGGST